MAPGQRRDGTSEERRPEPPRRPERETFYRLGSLVLVVVILYFGRVVLVPLVLALLLTVVLVPAVRRLQRLRIGRFAAVMIVMCIGLAVAGSLAWVVEQRVAKIASNWTEYKANIRAKSGWFVEWVGRFESYQAEIRTTFTPAAGTRTTPPGHPEMDLPPGETPPSPLPLPVRVVPEQRSLLASLYNWGGSLLAPFSSALLVVTMLTFMLLQWEDARERVLLLMGGSGSLAAKETLEEAEGRVSNVLIAQCAINGLFALVAALGLWVIHLTLGGPASVTAAITAGLLCGALRFIPYVGVWIGAGLSLLFIFAACPGNTVFVATLGMFVILEIFIAQWVEPR